jgi:pilus assembly protein CpaD
MADPKRLSQFSKIALVFAVIAGTAGCESISSLMPEFDAPKMPSSKRLQLQAIDHAHTVSFPAARADLLASEAERLVDFLRNRARAARYTLYVAPEHGELADDRAETVAAYLDAQGFHTRVLPAQKKQANSAGRVRVVVRSYTVTLPGCPDWTTEPGKSFDNVVHSNWGCATATNLGMMVADPGDLARGRQPGAADAELLSKRIQDYRKGETKALDPEDIGTIEAQQKTGGSGS